MSEYSDASQLLYRARKRQAIYASRCHFCGASVAADGERPVICDNCDELDGMDQYAHELAHGPGRI